MKRLRREREEEDVEVVGKYRKEELEEKTVSLEHQVDFLAKENRTLARENKTLGEETEALRNYS